MTDGLFRLGGTATVRVRGDGVDLARLAHLLRPYAERLTGVPEPVDVPHEVWFEAHQAESVPPEGRVVGEADRCLRVRSDPRSGPDQIFALQLVRALLVGQVLATHAPLHAAVVSREGGGIVFTGPKGAGKTSFVSAFLRRRPDFRFVSNDKSAVDPLSEEILGLPYAVAIGRDGLACTGELRGAPSRLVRDKHLFWPEEFASAFGTRLAARCRPGVVVLCHAEFDGTTVRISEDVGPEERARRLETEMSDLGDAMLRGHLLGGPPSPPPAGRLPSRWADLRWVRLRGNPWVMPHHVTDLLATTSVSEALEAHR